MPERARPAPEVLAAQAEAVAATAYWGRLRPVPFGVVSLPGGRTAAWCGRPSAARDAAFEGFLADAADAGFPVLAEAAHAKDYGAAHADGLPEDAARDWLRVALLDVPGPRLPDDDTAARGGDVMRLLSGRMEPVIDPFEVGGRPV